MADAADTTNPSRRSILAVAAALSVGALPVIAAALPAPDPVFAVIAEWRRLVTAHIASIDENERLGTEDSDEAEANATAAVSDFEHDVLFQSQPTTAAGAVALLLAIAEVIEPNWGGQCAPAIRAAAGVIKAA